MRTLIVGLFLAFATPLAAAPVCGPSVQMLQKLNRLAEVPIEQVSKPHEHGEITWIMWVNASTGTWTLTGTQGAITCAFVWGRTYEGQVIADFLTGEAT